MAFTVAWSITPESTPHASQSMSGAKYRYRPVAANYRDRESSSENALGVGQHLANSHRFGWNKSAKL
jgi:hypothetical protein